LFRESERQRKEQQQEFEQSLQKSLQEYRKTSEQEMANLKKIVAQTNKGLAI